ncbi:purine-cytosine permease family protein [Pseudonocardia phyllosphaerae]|uniref:purine-cytosine permease family protein n=1 Tax=Pseudonocardia phyllosphaerae TaxID=3390502 RepID=UPI00397DD434
MTTEKPAAPGADRGYGDRVVAVEPGANEPVPDAERHGSPLQLFRTWSSPNLEFATIFVGVLSVQAFGLTFGQAVAAIVLGNGLAAVALGVLSARGPAHGVPQMVLGRLAFGYGGNALPAGLMTLTSGFGWFAVNSVSAAFALSSLTGGGPVGWLVAVVVVQVGVAYFGHNLVQAFERIAFPLLAIVLGIGACTVLGLSDPWAAPPPGGPGAVAGFLLTVGAVFGYAAGWTPYAADYTRYLPRTTSTRLTGLSAGAGLMVSSTVLMVAGAASVSAATAAGLDGDNPVGNYVGLFNEGFADVTLLAIALGAMSANVLNVYSGAMAFLSLGVDVPMRRARAVVALVFGVVGFAIAAYALDDAAAGYEAFLLVVVYWIGPWLGVVLTEQWLRRGRPVDPALFYDRDHRNHAGPIALLVGIVVSVGLFANQELFVGLVARDHPEVGDIAFAVGAVLSAGTYVLLGGRERV